MKQQRLWFCLKFSIAIEFFFIDCIVSIDYSYINREIINSLPFLSRWNSCIKYLLSKFFIITLFFFLKVWSHCLHAGNYQYSLSNQSKYASALFMMLFWEALTADNSSLAHTMFAKYSTCSFFILTDTFNKGCLNSWPAQWFRKNKYEIWKIVFVSNDYQ